MNIERHLCLTWCQLRFCSHAVVMTGVGGGYLGWLRIGGIGLRDGAEGSEAGFLS